VVLGELESPTREIEELIRDADVIATSFLHVEELRELLPTTEDKLVALSVKPHLDSLVEIAGIRSCTSLLLVCLTESGAEHMKRSLENAGITARGVPVSCTRKWQWLGNED
jgi:hypothetical protein